MRPDSPSGSDTLLLLRVAARGVKVEFGRTWCVERDHLRFARILGGIDGAAML